MIDPYRTWFEQEKDSNDKTLGMVESVPFDRRDDPRFARVLTLAAHVCACRENWLDRMASGGVDQVDWWPESVDIETLRPRYAAMELRWTAYLASLTDEALEADFEFPVSGGPGYRWNIEGQVMQLVGHSFYHRGQIALLVDELGGDSVDTDYLYWAFSKNPDRWKRLT